MKSNKNPKDSVYNILGKVELNGYTNKLIREWKFLLRFFISSDSTTIDQMLQYFHKRISQIVSGIKLNQNPKTHINFTLLQYFCKSMTHIFNSASLPIVASIPCIDILEDNYKESCPYPVNDTLQLFQENPDVIPMHSIQESVESVLEGSKLMVDKDQKLILGDPSILFESECWKISLKELLFEVSNHLKCCIFFGVSPCHRVIGIQLDERKIKEIEKRINSIMKKDFFPQPENSDGFHLSFIKVREKQNKMMNPLHKKVLCLVKVQRVRKWAFYFDSEFKNNDKQKYFNVSSQIESKWKQMDNVQAKTYSQMLLNIAKYRSNKPRIVPKLKQFYGFTSLQIGYICSQLKQIDKKFYGEVPTFQYTNSCIIVVKDMKYIENTLKIFLNQEKETKYFQIYEKVTKYNNRRVFYLTTRGQINNLMSISEKLDKQKKNIIVLKIRKQISLCRQDFNEKAAKILIKRFEELFNEKIQILWKRNQNNHYQKIYYYRFRTEEQSVFAFAFLEYNDLRSVFCSDQTVKGSMPIQEYGQSIPKF